MNLIQKPVQKKIKIDIHDLRMTYQRLLDDSKSTIAVEDEALMLISGGDTLLGDDATKSGKMNYFLSGKSYRGVYWPG